MAVLALDIGASRVRSALVLDEGTLVGRRDAVTPRTPAELVDLCTAELRASLAAAREQGRVAPDALSISACGPVDPQRGEFLDPPNLDPSLWHFPLAPRLADALGLRATMGLDVHVAALGEGAFGAARGLADYVYVTVSTGVGGSIVSGGRLMRGADGLAGELGHLLVEIDGPPCGCGARGHLEAIVSGTGIARAARAAGLGEVSARQVAQLEDGGDAAARAIMERARHAFAEAVVTMVDVFNPQRIVVGGGIAIGQGERLLEPAREAVRDHGYRRQAERVEIVAAALGDDVGLIGGLALVESGRLGDD